MTEFVELKEGDDFIRAARENNEWLGVVDIAPLAPVTLTIAKIGKVKTQMEKGREVKGIALCFKEAKKKLILNATNRAALAEKHGRDPKNIIGKQITLKIERLPREFNGSTHGIVIA